MKTVKNLARRLQRLGSFLLCLMVDIVSNPAFADYTPTGAWGLPGGRDATRGRVNNPIRMTGCDRPRHPARTDRCPEHALPQNA